VQICVASIEGLQWSELDFPADLVRSRAIAAGWSAQNPSPDEGEPAFAGAAG
jgi:choline kinase